MSLLLREKLLESGCEQVLHLQTARYYAQLLHHAGVLLIDKGRKRKANRA